MMHTFYILFVNFNYTVNFLKGFYISNNSNGSDNVVSKISINRKDQSENNESVPLKKKNGK